jgi:hypothetical protein
MFTEDELRMDKVDFNCRLNPWSGSETPGISKSVSKALLGDGEKQNQRGCWMGILETRYLSHDFRGFKVLTDVNLEVEQGGAARHHRSQRSRKDDPLQCNNWAVLSEVRADP